MVKPITGLQCAILVAQHQQQLIPWVDKYVVRVMCCGSERRARSAGWLRLLFLILAPCSHACVLTICRYNSFLICLGMVRPVQVDGIWDKKHLAYNKYMASLSPRSMYYKLQKLLRTDVTNLLEECNSVWSAAWHIGGALCRDEAIVPHTGGRCMGLRQYIARKPHASGIKLYVLADNTGGGYLVDVYLYTGRRGRVRRFGSCAGNFDAKRIVGLWSRLIPPGTVFVADSFFGTHTMAQDLSARGTPYLMLIKKDKRDAGLTKAKESTQEGDCARHCGRHLQAVRLQEPEGWAQAPENRPLPYQLLVRGRRSRAGSEGQQPPRHGGQVPRGLPCRGRGKPNGAVNAPNDTEPLSTEAPFLGLRSRLRSVRYPRKLGERGQRQ